MGLVSIGPYQIIEKIGQGAMGEVFLAHDSRLHRKVAIKRLTREGADAPDDKRMLNEARAVARLNHPNIAAVYDVLDVDGRSHIVMEYVRGKSLAALVWAGPMAPTEIAKIGRQLADGLAEAHHAGIIHRDLKPANVAVDDAGHAKILDFGIARRVPSESGPTATGRTGESETGSPDDTHPRAGTPAYMAPERFRGEPATVRSDIYSLGVVLFECLTGKRPFGGLGGLREAVLHAPFPDLAEAAPRSPRDLNRIVCRAMEHDPSRRYGDARELSRDLAAVEAALSSRSTRRPWPPVTLAILPFKPLLPAARDEALELGVTETLINQLSQVSSMTVRPLATVRRYQDLDQDPLAAGRALGVDTVLEGSIQHAGDTTRVSVRLLDVGDGSTRLALRESAAATDLLALQDLIAGRVAGALNATLTDRRPLARQHTTNTDAYVAYLRGRHRLWRRTIADDRRAVELFQEAIALDGSYAHAHAGLAEAYQALSGHLAEKPHDVMPKAREAALRALQLDDSLAEAHTSLALVRGLYDYDWAGAEVEHRRAVALNPRSPEVLFWYGHLLRAVGRCDEAIAIFERAREIDPLSAEIERGIAHAHFAARRFDAAIEHSLKTIDLDPTFVARYLVLAWAYEAKGLKDQAVDARLKHLAQWPPSFGSPDLTGEAADEIAPLRTAYANAGWQGFWRRYLELARKRSLPPFQLAEIHVRLGETEEALQLLEKAYDERTPYIHHLKSNGVWDPLRSDPGFKDLLVRARLAP